MLQNNHREFSKTCTRTLGFPGGSEVKASASDAGDLVSIPRSGRSPGQEDPLQKEMVTHSSILP